MQLSPVMRGALGLILSIGLVACGKDRVLVFPPDSGTASETVIVGCGVVGAIVSCEPGVFRCNGTLLEQCTSGIECADWTSVQACASAALCDEVAGRCISPDAGSDAGRRSHLIRITHADDHVVARLATATLITTRRLIVLLTVVLTVKPLAPVRSALTMVPELAPH